MTNYGSVNEVPWYSQREKIKRIIIDEIEFISDYSFSGMINPEIEAVNILLQERMPEKAIITKEKKEKISKNNLDIIKEKTEYIILINNFNYKVNVSIRNEHFETKYYNNKIIQGGTYKTIVVSIGEAKGKNYWTILYPDYFSEL